MKFKRIGNHLYPLPKKATPGSAGYDLQSIEEHTIYPGESARIEIGWACKIPTGCVGEIRGRSSLALQGLICHFGTIDEDYLGPLAVVMHNVGNQPRILAAGDRVAQLVIVPIRDDYGDPPVEVAAFPDSYYDRGGGFGSTGR